MSSYSSVKTILSVLNATNTDFQTDQTPPPTPGNYFNTYNSSKIRRLHLGLSPLLSMEANLNKMLFSETSSGSQEISLPAGSKWKSKLGFPSTCRRSSDSKEPDRLTDSQNAMINTFSQLLEASKEDIASLWEDEDVQGALDERGVQLRDKPGL